MYILQNTASLFQTIRMKLGTILCEVQSITDQKNKCYSFSPCCGGSQGTPISLPFHILQLVKSLPNNMPEA